MNKPFCILAMMIFCASALAQQPEAAPATQPAAQPGVTLITLHMKQAVPEDIFDAIGKQAGVRFSDSDNVWDADIMGNPIDIDVDKQPFWQVMHDLCAKLNIQPYSNGSRNSKRISMQMGNRQMNYANLPYAVVNGCLIEATGFNRQQSIQYASMQPPQDNATIQLAIFIDPAMHLPAFRSSPKATEAVDDQGNSLIRPPGNNQVRYYEGFQWVQGLMTNTQVMLYYPPKVGKKIATLKFTMACRAAEGVKTLTFDKLAQPSTESSDDMDVTVKSLKTTKGNNGQPDRYTLSVQVRTDDRNDMMYSLLQSGQLLDAKGHAFQSEGSSGGGGMNGTYNYTVNYSGSRNGGDDDDATGQPAKWTLDVPTHMRTTPMPVELKDLPLP